MVHIPLHELINEQITEAIDTVPYMSTLFSNPTVDRSHIGVTSESDFYLVLCGLLLLI